MYATIFLTACNFIKNKSTNNNQLCLSPGQMTASSPRPLAISTPPLGSGVLVYLTFPASCSPSPFFSGLVSYKLADHVVMEVAGEPFRQLSLTLGPAVPGGPSTNLGGAMTMCLP